MRAETGGQKNLNHQAPFLEEVAEWSLGEEKGLKTSPGWSGLRRGEAPCQTPALKAHLPSSGGRRSSLLSPGSLAAVLRP